MFDDPYGWPEFLYDIGIYEPDDPRIADDVEGCCEQEEISPSYRVTFTGISSYNVSHVEAVLSRIFTEESGLASKLSLDGMNGSADVEVTEHSAAVIRKRFQEIMEPHYRTQSIVQELKIEVSARLVAPHAAIR